MRCVFFSVAYEFRINFLTGGVIRKVLIVVS